MHDGQMTLLPQRLKKRLSQTHRPLPEKMRRSRTQSTTCAPKVNPSSYSRMKLQLRTDKPWVSPAVKFNPRTAHPNR